MANTPKPLAGKTALVTGASRGIGRAIAQRLGAEGAFTVVHYNGNRDAAEETLRGILAAGGQGATIQANLEHVEDIKTLAAALPGVLPDGKLDILINNAGIGSSDNGYHRQPIEDIQRLIDINIRGVFLVTHQILPLLQDNGRIVNISSALSRLTIPNATAYSATKGAVDVFSRHLASELGARGITVNAVAPGGTRTDMNAALLETEEGTAFFVNMQALKRTGEPEDIAGVVAFLVGPDGGWTTGQVIDASGGTRL